MYKHYICSEIVMKMVIKEAKLSEQTKSNHYSIVLNLPAGRQIIVRSGSSVGRASPF